MDKNSDIKKPPRQKAVIVEPAIIFMSGLFNSQPPINRLTHPHTIFTAGLDLGANGVICRLPQIPWTKCGIALNKTMPEKNTLIKSITLTPPSVYIESLNTK